MAITDVNLNNSHFIEILKSFSKKTTINDTRDFMEKSLFMIFDTKDEKTGECDGKFDEQEWTAFEKFRNTILKNLSKCVNNSTLVDENAVEYYSNEVRKIEENIAKLTEEFNKKFSVNYFEELGKYEQSHNLILHGLKDGESNPAGTFLLEDIEPFGIGIPNEQKGRFEEIYKEGYTEGFENLTQEEQNEYIELYKKAIDWCKKRQEFEENVLGKEIDKLHNAIIMLNASTDGEIIGDYLSTETQKQKLSAWESQNPFLQQIEKFEQQLTRERLKFNPDASKINELQNMLIGLYQLSEEWRTSFNNKETDSQKEELLNITGSITGIHRDEEGGQFFVTSPNLSVKYGEQNIGFTLNGSIDNKFSTQNTSGEATSDNFQQAYKLGISSYYNNGGKLQINQNSNLSINPEFSMQNHVLSLNYKNTTLTGTECIRTIPMQLPDGSSTQNQTTSTLTLGVSQRINSFNTNTAISFAPEGTSYTLNTGWNYSSSDKKPLVLTLNSGIGGSYTNIPDKNYHNLPEADIIDKSKLPEEMKSTSGLYTANANLSTGLKYDNKTGITANLVLNDFVSTQFPKITNNFTTMLSTNYKNMGINIAYTNTYSPEQKMNTIATGVNFKAKSCEIEAAYSYSKNSTNALDEIGNMTTFSTNENMLSATLRLYFGKSGKQQK